MESFLPHFPFFMFNIRQWLSQTHAFYFSLYGMIAAFGTYFCAFAFRKPFTSATFDNLVWVGIHYKTVLVVAQVLGYMLSKFIGIKIVAEMQAGRRAWGLLAMIGISQIAWVFFGFVPAPYNFVFLILNGLPLGMVFGLVLGFLEGRRLTEILSAALCASFIMSSGVVRSIGAYLLQDWQVSEWWMPFWVGLIFIPPILFFTWLLNQIPPPSAADELLRTRREPMSGKARWEFFKRFALGLVLLVLTYILLTIYRDFRENFGAEIWKELGFGNKPEVFAQTEISVGFLVLFFMGLFVFLKNNWLAFTIQHVLVLVGMLSVGLSTWLFGENYLSPLAWMVSVGVGLYVPYVIFNGMLFERLIAVFRQVGNIGFLIYLADSFGYLGSIGVMLYKDFGQGAMRWLDFFVLASYWVSGLGILLTVASFVYFYRKKKGIFS